MILFNYSWIVGGDNDNNNNGSDPADRLSEESKSRTASTLKEAARYLATPGMSRVSHK